MSKASLGAIFDPRSVALIGSGADSDPIGRALAASLRASRQAGFGRHVMAVGPWHREIGSRHCFDAIASLPEAPDLALVCAPATEVAPIIEALGALGTRAAAVVTAGFAERRSEGGAELQAALRTSAARYGLRILGPNCFGVLAPGIHLDASLAQRMPRAGNLAFVAQSGAILSTIIDRAADRGIGFSHLLSLGDMADVGFGEVLDYLASDFRIRAILLHMEAIADARRFMSAARAAARMKPVVVVKAGRCPDGARAVAAHTGLLAGDDAVYEAALRRAGLLRVRSLAELFDAAEVLALAKPPRGRRLAILSNSGGLAALAADALVAQGGELAELTAETLADLSAALPPAWSRANPVDILEDASGARYKAALKILIAAPGVDGVAVLYCPTPASSPDEVAAAVVEVARAHPGRPLLTSWLGEASVRAARRTFAAHRIPSYAMPDQAARAFMHLVRYRESQQLLMETPPSLPEDHVPDTAGVRALIAGIDAPDLERRGGWLTEIESKRVLSAYGIPTVSTRLAETPELAGALAAEMGGRVALRLVALGAPNRSAAGCVVLDLHGAAEVRQQAEALLARLTATHPESNVIGFSLAPMAHRPQAQALVLGVSNDSQFGPVLTVGQAGNRAEPILHKAVGLPPLNMRLARELLSHSVVDRLLQACAGPRSQGGEAAALALVRLSQLVCDVAEVNELEIDPLLVDDQGAIALDSRIRLATVPGAPRDPGERLAIRPYPKALEEPVTLGDGRRLLLRPILPEDEPALQEAFTRLTPEEVRLRFFVPMRTLSHVAAARFTQLDYDREMALVLTDPGIPGRTPIYAVVSLSADADNASGEYAVLVRHDMAGMGLGILLMRRIIDYARARGLREIVGDVLRENRTMLKLCKLLGFTTHRDRTDLEIVKVRLKLDTGAT